MLAKFIVALFLAVCVQQGLTVPVLTNYHYSVNLTNTLVYVTDLNTPAPSYFQLYYTVENVSIHLGLVVDGLTSDGWVGFGFSQRGLMPGSDAAVIMVNSTGAYIEDFILISTNTPTIPCDRSPCPDSSQTSCKNSFTSVSGRREGNYIVAEWTRPLAAADQCDLQVKVDEPQYIVYAIGKFGTTLEWPFNLIKHDKYVNVLNGDNSVIFNTAVPPPTNPTAATNPTHVTPTHATTGQAAITTTNQNSGDISSNLVYSLTALLLAVMVSFGF